jgi:hypothetical protein
MVVFVPSTPAKKKGDLANLGGVGELGRIEKKWEDFYVFDHTPPIKK